MAINTEMAGKTFGSSVRDYAFRDLELFALGRGVGIDGKDGFEYINEHDECDPHLKALPMFGVMLIVDSEVIRTIGYGYNYAGLLHWGFDIIFHKLIAKMSDHLETMVHLEGSCDRGEGRDLLAQHIGDTYDSDGDLPFTNEPWNCLTYDGGWGGPRPPKDIVEVPSRPADVEATETTPENQVLIYRLSGDYYSQHTDWDYAAENGGPRPILHAIFHVGVVMCHVINVFIPEEPERIARFKTRITSPVHLGTTLKTRLWKIKEGELRFALVDANADETDVKPRLNWRIIKYR